MDSTCFIHSHLDQAAKLGEYLKNKTNKDSNDVGVTKALQDPSTQYLLPSQPSESGHDNVDIEDNSLGNLKTHLHLAATAIGVREMSKQLGKIYI